MSLQSVAKDLVGVLLETGNRLALCETVTDGVIKAALQLATDGPLVLGDAIGPPHDIERMYDRLGLSRSHLQHHAIDSLFIERLAWKAVEPALSPRAIVLLTWGCAKTGDPRVRFKSPKESSPVSLEWNRGEFDQAQYAESVAIKAIGAVAQHYRPIKVPPV